MSTRRQNRSRAATVIREPNCKCLPWYTFILVATKLTCTRHCVDADQTYDVSLTLESESESESSHTATEESEHDHDHASDTEAESSGEITEVTSCHPHVDVLYCIADGGEWEVTTEVDATNAPESYSGCHLHGPDELHCTEGDVEVSLSRASAESSSHEESSSSSSSSAAAGEAVDCHSHAGVE
jgi:hypothetical protein